MSPSEILSGVSDWITGSGRWLQGAAWRDADGVLREGKPAWNARATCLLGAIVRFDDTPNTDVAVRALAAQIGRPADANWKAARNVIRWNDEPSRTHREVVYAVREASKKLQGTGL